MNSQNLMGKNSMKKKTNVRVEAGYMNHFFETTRRDQFKIITFVHF